MKFANTHSVELEPGYWFSKEKLNREVTINSVYEQFSQSGRIKAFNFDWREGEPQKPHIYWDSDVAKWMEGAAYSLKKHPDKALEAKVDSLIEKIAEHQGADGYFNIYFTVIDPSKRFTGRDNHELYCAGHLIEAAIACDEIGKPQLLETMKKYVAYIEKVFLLEKSAYFASPGHEEIELALLRMYRHTKDAQCLRLAKYFIDVRGTENDFAGKTPDSTEPPRAPLSKYSQSHLPVRRQTEAVGHCVRALYLYTGMAMLAKETNDRELLDACRALFYDITNKKMYITGGVGSTHIGEAFTNAYDLPHDIAYAETCAAIALMFFCRAMLENEPNAVYADTLERAFYNGVLSGLSLGGNRFFYENALEINLNEHFNNGFGAPRFPITQRPELFGCSCCPPNLNRLLSSLGGYLFSLGGDTLFIHEYTASRLSENGVTCTVKTEYPVKGEITVTAENVKTVALRIPSWCEKYEISRPYELKDGYAYIENDGSEIRLSLDVTPRAVFSNRLISRDAYKLAVMRGPVVYCAEAIDNEALQTVCLPQKITAEETLCQDCGLPKLTVDAYILQSDSDAPYKNYPDALQKTKLHLIPYSAFANRGECDMRVWFSMAPAL